MTYEGFPSKTQFFKAGVPGARRRAAADTARPNLRAELLCLIEGGLVLNEGGEQRARAEALLARYDEEQR